MEIRLAGLEPESIVDGPGYRFTVFVQGCPHNCPGCHNPQTPDFGGGHIAQTDDVIAHQGQNPLVRGLTLSGGEPMMQPEPLYLIAKAAKEKGMNVIEVNKDAFKENVQGIYEKYADTWGDWL